MMRRPADVKKVRGKKTKKTPKQQQQKTTSSIEKFLMYKYDY